ncbi:MAG: hypothetical protein HEP71_34770 [Roseivirga sp.]|nr:hypothetical protein [Roseivirga sp.]
MKSTIETKNCMHDALYKGRFSIRKNLLAEARDRGLQLVDENVVVFSHQEISAVAAPFDIDPTELDKNQPLIFFYFKGNTRATLKDGFYIVQGNLDKNGISPKNLILLNEDGKEVQTLKITQGKNANNQSKTGWPYLDVTDYHYVKSNGKTTQEVSGTLNGHSFNIKTVVKVSPKE